MYILKSLTFICLLAVTPILTSATPMKYLEERIPPDNHRHQTFSYVLKLMEERNVKIVVETGTARDGTANCLGDGCSTVIFADWADDHDAQVFSVDIDPEALSCAAGAIPEKKHRVNFIESDSINFLKNFGQTIDFLYLDSFDFESWNPLPSQQHHLAEIKAALPWLGENSIVMIDDCDLPDGGKGTLVIAYLIEKGWKIIADGYQVILTRN